MPEPVKTMKRYSGASHRAQRLIDKIEGKIKGHGTLEVGSKGWEANLEVKKLKRIISDRSKLAKKGSDLTLEQKNKLDSDVTHLEHQLRHYENDLKVNDKSKGKRHVAAEDVPTYATPHQPLTAKQKRDLKVKQERRTLSKEEYQRLEWHKRFAGRRRRGVSRFWSMERQKLVLGEPGSRNWTDQQKADITAGRTPKHDDKSIEGHHKHNALDHPQIADDGNNIYPATKNEHLRRWHGNNFRNDTFGEPLNSSHPEEF